MLIGAGIGVYALVQVFGEDEHSLTVTSTAGGMKRDKSWEEQNKQGLDAAEKQIGEQFKNVAYLKSGAYEQDDADRGPEGRLIFFGAKFDEPQKKGTFSKSFEKLVGSNGSKISKVSTGDDGGEAVCASQESTGQALCAWSSNDTVGYLAPTVAGYDAKKLAKIMREVRDDVEDDE